MKRLYGLLSALFIFSAQLTWAQNIDVRGRITDANGAGIPDASVSIKGTKNGTKTAVDGSFKLNARSGVTLIISAIGFSSKEVIASSDNITISLALDAQGLNEVVVTALGIKREKRSLGYSTQTVGNDALNKSGSGNPLSELNGKVSDFQKQIHDSHIDKTRSEDRIKELEKVSVLISIFIFLFPDYYDSSLE